MGKNGFSKMFSLITFLVVSFFSLSTVFSCTLAQHDWISLYSLDFPLDESFLSSIDFFFLKTQFDKLPVPPTQIIWVTKNRIPGIWEMLSSVILNVPGSDRSVAFSRGGSALEPFFSGAETREPVLISGSNDSRIQIVLFADKNSDYSCFQVVFLYRSKVREILISPGIPWAEEFPIKSWVNIIFLGFPVPTNIISSSVSTLPRSPTIKLYERTSLVEELLKKNVLKIREIFTPEPEIPIQ